MKANECTDHQLRLFNLTVADADIQCPYCRIAELEKLLKRIYEADATDNNGAVMGEAMLCAHFRIAIRKALERGDE